MAWYNENWDHRFKVTVAHGQVAGDLTGFPFVITEANVPVEFWANVKADGTDIVVTGDDGTTKLKRELVSITVGTPTMELWVKHNLLGDTDVDIYIYYGYAAASETNDADVWDANFISVWHMQNLVESKAGRDLSNPTPDSINNPAALYDGAVKKLGKNYVFAADADIGKNNETAYGITGTITIEAWINPLSNTQSNYSKIVAKMKEADYPYELDFGDQAAFSRKIEFYIASTEPDHYYCYSNTLITQGEWAYVAGVYDDDYLRFYWDGVEDNTAEVSSVTLQTNTMPICIGGRFNIGTMGFNGYIDEVRISNVNRSANWLLTTFNTINAPLTFYGCGAQEIFLPASGVTNSQYTSARNDLYGSGRNVLSSVNDQYAGTENDLYNV